MTTTCNHEVALTRQLDEIRRVEGINTKLLAALERIFPAPDAHLDLEDDHNAAAIAQARTAIKEAKGEA